MKGNNENKQTYLFQFHKGTIKTCNLDPATLALAGFQFHKGTIKTRNIHQRCFGCRISIP